MHMNIPEKTVEHEAYGVAALSQMARKLRMSVALVAKRSDVSTTIGWVLVSFRVFPRDVKLFPFRIPGRARHT